MSRSGAAAALDDEATEGELDLDRLLAPVTRDEFARAYLGRKPMLCRGRAGRFADLLSWPALNTLIRNQRLAGPRFRLMKGSRMLPEEAYHRTITTLRGPLRQIDPARLLRELRQGATLVWDAVDQHHPPLRPIKHALEHSLRGLTWINVYASWGVTSGVGAHWDDHDVFVLQVTGRKHWRVHAPTRPAPLGDDVVRPQPPDALTDEYLLEAGDLLYLPRGWWHLVTPVDEPSLHLTAGVLRPTNADFLRWLVERAKESELVRDDFPWPLDNQQRSDHAAALRAVLERWLVPGSVAEFVSADEQGAYLDPRPTLQAVGSPDAAAWDPRAEVLLLGSRARLEERDSAAVLVIAGQEWTLPLAGVAALRDLVEGRAVAVGLVARAITAPVLSALVTAGLVAVA